MTNKIFMTRKASLLITATILAISFWGCKKDYSNENFNGNPIEIKPDFSPTTISSVAGFITNSNGSAIEGALVTAGSKSTMTDAFGYFNLTEVTMPELAGFIKVTKTGFFDGFRTFFTENNTEKFVRLQLITETETGVIAAGTGGSVQTPDGAIVKLPANAIVTNGGTPYIGNVHVAANWLNPTGGNKLALTMPGDLRGIDSSGNLKILETFGMMAVNLKDDAGQKLQISNGQVAELTLPIPAALQASAPATIAFWSFNESNGLWKQEGMATKSGNQYIGKASHFSFWNCDAPFPLVNFKAQFVNEKLAPIANLTVRIIKSGSNTAGYGYTDTLGKVTGSIPANSQLTVEVLSNCGTVLFTKNFTSTTAAVDLGTISIGSKDQLVTIFGSVEDCSNQPVENGYVLVKADSFYYRLPVKNGIFNNTFAFCNTTATAATALTIDNVNNVQGTDKNVSIEPGSNDLGLLIACGTSIEEYITYKIDGASYNFVTGDSMTAFFTNNLTYINGNQSGNGTSDYKNITFSFNGSNAATGIHNLTFLGFSNPFKYSNQNITPAVLVTIEEYGSVNEFIKGSFTTTVLDTSSTSHSFECNFRVRRSR
jgi:hypothetical protein